MARKFKLKRHNRKFQGGGAVPAQGAAPAPAPTPGGAPANPAAQAQAGGQPSPEMMLRELVTQYVATKQQDPQMAAQLSLQIADLIAQLMGLDPNATGQGAAPVPPQVQQTVTAPDQAAVPAVPQGGPMPQGKQGMKLHKGGKFQSMLRKVDDLMQPRLVFIPEV